MSAIGGLINFDGRPVEKRDLERAANALKPYGPDRSGVMASNNMGFVHTLMRMTPEDRFDRQPLLGQRGVMITAAVRLDNREQILARLGVAPIDAQTWSDTQVVLAAWERFRDDLWEAMQGPFAVAIWDPADRTLTLARDHLGHNVAMWHRCDRFFAFATMPKGLFAIADVPRELNEEKFADFLVLNHSDHLTTMYRNVYRVLPAHFMKVSAAGVARQHRYWSAKQIPRIRLSSNEAYAEGMREVLDRAVRRQLRSAHKVGCFLSGGLDSSSVAVLAARALGSQNKRLSAFTQIPRDEFDGPVPVGRYGNEKPYVEAICAAAGNIDVNYIRNSDCDDFGELERMFLALEAPVRNPTNLGWMLAIPHRARAQECRVLLGGAYGNYTISWYGWSQAVDHLLRGKWVTAYRQWRLYYKRSSHSRRMALLKLFAEPLLPAKIGDWMDWRHRGDAPVWAEHSAIDLNFAKAMGVDQRAREGGHDFLYRVRPGERLEGLTPVDYHGEWQAAVAAITGVEVRDPTSDLDVVAYCLGVPPEQFLAEGIDRSLVRRAMWGMLPEIVLTNRLIGIQSADWYEKIENQRPRLLSELRELSTSPLAAKAIDIPRLEKALAEWPSSGWQTQKIADEYHLALSRGYAGGRFLRWIEGANSPHQSNQV